MHGDPGYYRFFAYLSLFAFSMLMLVLANNYLLLYFGWEAVGLCSYYLIGFFYHKPEAAAAGKKAFIVNRVGDFGFGLGVMLIFVTFGTLNYTGVFEQVGQGVGEPRRADRPSPCCCSWGPWASRRSSRCTCGCPTPWRAPPRSRPSSTPPPWSPPGSTWWPAAR